LTLARAAATERRLLEPIAEFAERDGYLVYRSDRFPDYYAGNGIEIRDPGGRNLRQWEAIFRREFDSDLFRHRTFSFQRAPELEPLAAEAREAGYKVIFLSYLIATRPLGVGPPPAGLSIERIETEDGWQRLLQFEDRTSPGYDWYEGPESTASLLAKTRHVSEKVGIEWLALVEDGGAIASKLGFFRHGPVYRLQEVATAEEHRRRGLCSYLLRLVLRRALEEDDAEGVVVSADRDYHAIDLYRKLGFEEVGETVELMRFPHAADARGNAARPNSN
jgi:ribosomal protein S18 acetylase RimI-like enzyme